jgi:hypothetical protein
MILTKIKIILREKGKNHVSVIRLNFGKEVGRKIGEKEAKFVKAL